MNECQHPKVTVEYYMIYPATFYQPAEYGGVATCEICGEQMDYEDIPEGAEVEEV